MKKINIAFQVILIVFLITSISCKKDNNPDNPKEPDVKKKYAWVCGQADSTGYGLILFSADSGNTWTRQGSGQAVLHGIDVTDIWAVDENNVWAIGTNNTVLKTSDKGNTWNKINLPNNPANLDLMAISIVNKTNIWISGNNGTIYHSVDNGNSWTLCDTAFFGQAFLQGIWAINQNKVYVVGGMDIGGYMTGFVAYTLDGGITWDSLVPADNYNINEWIGVTSSGNTIVIYGGKAHYMVSTDGGTTWKNDSVPNTGGMGGADINHLIMLNPQTWWGAFDMGQIFITYDGGASWLSQQTGQGGFFMLGIDAWDSQLALAVGAPTGSSNNCPIIKTINGGALWENKYNTSNATLYKITFIKD